MFVISVQSKVDYSLVTSTVWAVSMVVCHLNTSHVSYVFTVFGGKIFVNTIYFYCDDGSHISTN